jgi:menaquinone reductase, multiheme cytochrome c subunit
MTEPPLPEWVNRIRPFAGAFLLGVPVYLLFLLYAGGSPQTTDVGYSPRQPVPYSHQVHVGQMGMDCRYCHTTVEGAAFAAVPPTSVCMNCHKAIATEAESTALLRQSMETGKPVPWVRVHDLPDYVYFDHHAHVGRGVACVSCHGRIDRMEQVHQVNTLSMGWCLDCHRDPAPNLRPVEFVTRMDWLPGEEKGTVPICRNGPEGASHKWGLSPFPARELGRRLMEEKHIAPSEDCSTCHR